MGKFVESEIKETIGIQVKIAQNLGSEGYFCPRVVLGGLGVIPASPFRRVLKRMSGL